MLYIKVNGVEITHYEVGGTLNIDLDMVYQSNYCSFTMRDPPFAIREGMEVIVYRDDLSNKKFAGLISELTIRPIAGFTAFEYEITASGYSEILNYRLVARSYTNKTCKEIIVDIIAQDLSSTWSITTVNVQNGPNIESITFDYVKISDALNQLCKLVGYNWYVDFDKDLHFFTSETSTAPFEMIDSSLFLFNGFYLRPQLSQIRNKITVVGGYFLSMPVAEQFNGDGTLDTYTLGANPSNISITEAAVDQTVGLLNIDPPATVNYLLDYWSRTIKRTAGNLGIGVVLQVTYNYEVKVITQAINTVGQTLLVALQGGDGVRELMLYEPTIVTLNEAQTFANQQVVQYGSPTDIITGGFKTFEDGFNVGQKLIINFTGFLYNGEYLINHVVMRCLSNDTFQYDVRFAYKSA